MDSQIFITMPADQFFIEVRKIVAEELSKRESVSASDVLPTHDMIKNRVFVTIKEACAILSTSRVNIYTMVRDKRIRLYKNKGRSYLHTAEISSLFVPQ
jgi:excisionase family DNA binding protein